MTDRWIWPLCAPGDNESLPPLKIERPAIPSIVTDPFDGPPADDVPDSLDVGREHDDTTRQTG